MSKTTLLSAVLAGTLMIGLSINAKSMDPLAFFDDDMRATPPPQDAHEFAALACRYGGEREVKRRIEERYGIPYETQQEWIFSLIRDTNWRKGAAKEQRSLLDEKDILNNPGVPYDVRQLAKATALKWRDCRCRDIDHLIYAKDLISDPDLPETINREEYSAIFQDLSGKDGAVSDGQMVASSARDTEVSIEHRLRCVLALLALPPDHRVTLHYVRPGEREQWALWALENDPLAQEGVDPARAAWLAAVLAEHKGTN